MRSAVGRNVVMLRIPVVSCVRCHEPHPMKIQKTFACVCVGEGGLSLSGTVVRENATWYTITL